MHSDDPSHDPKGRIKSMLIRWSKILALFTSLQLMNKLVIAFTGILVIRNMDKIEYGWYTIATNIAGGITNLTSLTKWVPGQFATQLDWDDVKHIKAWWGGKLIIKGIMDPDDAKMAQECGANALVVSNHGGRQLDGVNSSISTLPEIKKAVSDMDILMDGGISSGQDILKAIALGAEGVMIGRSFVYGLSAKGKEGVINALEILNKELDMTMALCGRRDIKDVNRDIIKDCPFFEKN